MLNIIEKTTIDNKIIANHINEFFNSIAVKLTETILTPKSTFHSYLTKINENSFFVNPILPPLKKLKTLQALLRSIPIKILKDLKKKHL